MSTSRTAQAAENEGRQKQLPRWRLYLIALVTFAELAHLAWEHFHGGVVSHHILNRADLPAISNWLGALLLPALTWFLSGRFQRRMALRSGGKNGASKLPVSAIAGFFGSLLFGILLSIAFTHGYETAAAYLFGSMLVAAVLLPVYRAECVLGFILGMTFTFGAVLPTAIGSLIAAVSAVIHLVMFPMFMRLLARFKQMPSTSV